VDAAVLAPGDVAQILQIADVVDVGEEARLAVVAALDDVLGMPGRSIRGWRGMVASVRGWATSLREPSGTRRRIEPRADVGKFHSDPGFGLVAPDGEEARAGTRELYIHYGAGMARSKFKLPAAARGTALNINTVAKLAAMARE